MKSGKYRLIFDTNVWISFLIGKQLASIKQHISNEDIAIIITEQILAELKIVTSREKFKKYFPEHSIRELIDLLDIIAKNVDIKPTHFLSRDPKDDFLLDLIDYSKADYLVTGDKDLLELNIFKQQKY